MAFNQTTTTKNDVDDGPQLLLETYLYGLFMSVLILLTVAGNSGTIMAFWKERSLREKPSDLLILSLSITDLGVGISLILFVPEIAIGKFTWGKTVCKLYVYFGTTFIIVGIFTTALISLDRYLLISREYPTYMKLQSRRRIVFSIVYVWLFACIFQMTEVILWDRVNVAEQWPINEIDYAKNCRSPAKFTLWFPFLYFTTEVFLPLAAVEMLSVSFLVLLRRKLRNRVESRDTVDENSTSTNASVTVSSTRTATNVNPGRKRYVKAAVTLGALVLTLNACMLPYVIYAIVVGVFCPRCEGPTRAVLLLLACGNSCFNPFLYAVTMSKIRNFYKALLFKRRL